MLGLSSLEGTMEAKLGLNTLNTVRRVDVLNHCNLVASSGTLPGDNSGISEEVFPDLDD